MIIIFIFINCNLEVNDDFWLMVEWNFNKDILMDFCLLIL